MDLQTWDGPGALERADLIWQAYQPVFEDQPDQRTWRERVFERHCAREAFRFVAALAHERVIGFGYGYVGHLGEYWTDQVAAALPSLVPDWVEGTFQVVSLGVLPDHRRRGIGRLVFDTLTQDLPVGRAILGAVDAPEAAAPRLYHSRGWTRLGVLRPGVMVMGRMNPVAPAR